MYKLTPVRVEFIGEPGFKEAVFFVDELQTIGNIVESCPFCASLVPVDATSRYQHEEGAHNSATIPWTDLHPWN